MRVNAMQVKKFDAQAQKIYVFGITPNSLTIESIHSKQFVLEYFFTCKFTKSVYKSSLKF